MVYKESVCQVTDTNKCKEHTWAFVKNLGDFPTERICYFCGLKQTLTWLATTLEET